MSTATKLTSFLVAALTGLALSFSAENPVVPPNEKDILGAWSGYEDGCVYFYRVVLEKKEEGTCQVVFTDNTVDSYIIDHWQIRAGKLEMHLSPAKKKQERMKMNVVAVDNLSMEVVITGIHEKWRRKAVLYNEREFLKKLEKSKNSLKKVNGNQ